MVFLIKTFTKKFKICISVLGTCVICLTWQSILGNFLSRSLVELRAICRLDRLPKLSKLGVG